MSGLFLLNLSPLHPQISHITQQQIFLIIDVPLNALLNGLDYPHPHHVYSELSLCAYCKYSFVYVLQFKPLDAFNDRLKLEVEFVVADLVNFCEDDLDSDVVLICSFQELDIRILQAMLEVDAKKYLRKSGRDLHVFVSKAEPQFPSFLVHLGEAIARSIDEKALLICNMMEVEKLCCS